MFMAMSRSLPPLGWFRAFECAATRLSFTAAAEELGLTQSAVSQQIRSLESRLGCRLFVRKHRGIALTDDGRKLLPDVARAIEAIRTATAPFDSQADPDVLTVATSVSVAQWYLAPELHRFVAQHDDLQVRLLTSVWPDELSDTTDVQIRFGPARDNDAGEVPLGDNQLILVASPALYGPEKNSSVTSEQLKQYPLIQAVGTSDTWAHCARHFGLVDHHRPTLFVDTHGLAVDFAVAGSGVALTSKLIATPAIRKGHLVQINPVSINATDGFFIAVTSQRRATLARQFIDWLLGEL